MPWSSAPARAAAVLPLVGALLLPAASSPRPGATAPDPGGGRATNGHPAGGIATDRLAVGPRTGTGTADPIFTVTGHGHGHGRGLSQYGARGAALRGRTAAQILDQYYPGSRTTAIPANQPIRVRLLGTTTNQLQVQGTPGLVVRDAATGRALRLTDPGPRYRIVLSPAGMSVQYTRDRVHWPTLRFGPAAVLPGPLTFGGAPVLRLYLPGGTTARDYQGTLTALRTGPRTLATVNRLGPDQYVAGVLGREMPASWPAAALRAQAVAARTYSAYERAHVPAGRGWDTCDSTACQVYGGRRLYAGGQVTDLQPASVLAAVRDTAGLVRSWAGQPIFAQFGASNGGYSVAGPVPYLVARPDPDDALDNPRATWTREVPGSALARCARLATVTGLTVLTRDGHGDWGGRLVTVRLTGTAGTGAPATADVTGTALRTCLPATFPSTYATFTE